MGGTTPIVRGYEEGTNNVSSNTFTGSSGTQMQLDPTQRRFLPFNNNLPANMYGPVTTGKTYEDSPYFIQPYVAPVVTTNNDTSTYTPVATDDAGNTATYLGVDPYDPEGDDNFLTQEEVDSRVKIIQDTIGNPNYNPNTDVLNKEQQDLVMNQTTTLDGNPNTNDYANRADIVMDDIYNNNQQIYGTETGNNVTSLVTGKNTGTPAPWTPPGMDFGYGVGVTKPSTTYEKFIDSITGPPVENKVTSYSHATDNDRPPGPGDTGWEQAQLLSSLQRGGTGIIYKDDRREVYLDGVLIGNPKRAETADRMLAEAKAAKEAARDPGPPPMPQYNNNGTPMVTQNYNYGTNMVTPGGK